MAIFGALATVLELSGTSWARLGNLLESFWSHVGVLLEVRSHLESVLEVIFASIARTIKNIGRYGKNEGSEEQELRKSKQDIHREVIFWFRI